MNPPPPGWPRISSSLFYDDAPAAIDFLCKAFGFEVALRVDAEDGTVTHSQLTYGDGLVMVSSTQRPGRADLGAASPRAVEGRNTQCLCVYVDAVDAHCARARAAGATIPSEPETQDYGEDYWADRGYRAIDPEGHGWFFVQRVRGPGAA